MFERIRKQGVTLDAALIGSGLLIVFAALRVMFFANWDYQASLAILAVADRPTILLGTFVYTATYGAAIVIGLPGFFRWLTTGNSPDQPFTLKLRSGILVPIVTLVIFAAIPIVNLAALIVASIVARLIWSPAKKHTKPGRPRPGPKATDFVLLLYSALLASQAIQR